ncbi:sugar transferase [Cereibacter sphaeroides]|uniref:sugar transferase n=1 Tax=Cereibacter sphaeroides TaxID=1063 RepID=UPI001F1685F0|nr:sugar transferase [Cereibacter sphaeroides]MCE6961060.1 sugar transferase [Cereibacter sphaeroides]MCE6975117.1 sugar transferase [Cereibacter sphaeroides]
MSPAKRVLDVTLALLLMLLLAAPFAVLLVVLLAVEGRPLFYVAERMKAPGQPFDLWKLRTMRPAAQNAGVSGGDKQDRVTRTGRLLRRSRLDEVPQLWNVLKGDMSFVGPRPPLRLYVERFPALYARVLESRPGITGLASLHFHRHEERLLSRCRSPEETDAVYSRRCIPRKARLDLIYQHRRSLCMDLMLMQQTIRRVLLLRNKQFSASAKR